MPTSETGPPNDLAARTDRAAPAASAMGAVRTAVENFVRPDVPDLASHSSNELAEMRTSLAMERNMMAADRTLMAWVRTSLSLFSFGFTIYKVLQQFQSSGVNLPHDATPRNIGLFLSGMGTIAMLMGTIEYWQTLSTLRHLERFRLMRAPLIMALFMSGMGVVLFFAIITELF